MKYDYAVVGAGSAGAVVAARLSENADATVVLIEAGPDYPDFDQLPDDLKFGRATAAYAATHSHLWSLVAQAAEGQPLTPLPRGKVVGGTSAVNGQVFLRAVTDDFRDWVAAGNDRWSYDESLPYYRKLENDLDFRNQWHGADGPVPVRRYQRDTWQSVHSGFLDACVAAGYPECPDANEPGAVGVGPIPFNNVDGIRASTAVAYLAPARGRPNLTILADTLARRLRLRGDVVVGIEVETRAGREVVAADHYILSAGAVGTPHLLMLSGIGPAAMLRGAGITVSHDIAGVGQNLGDHHLVDVVWDVDRPRVAADDTGPVVQAALRYTSGSGFVDDMQITARGAVPGRASEPLVALVPSIELPRSMGRLSLVSPDPQVQPSIELGFLRADEDRQRLRDGVAICIDLARSPELATILKSRLGPTDEDLASVAALDRWLYAQVRTSHHLCGSARMGPPSDPMAVVDQFGCVRGLDNLRIVDASIFPQVIRANLNATVMMVGERIADVMKNGPGRSVPSDRVQH